MEKQRRVESGTVRCSVRILIVNALLIAGAVVVDPNLGMAQEPSSALVVRTPSTPEIQRGTPLPGAQVRVRDGSDGSQWITGELVSEDEDFIRIRPTPEGVVYAVDLRQVQDYEVVVGEKNHLLIGALVGGALGKVIGFALKEPGAKSTICGPPVYVFFIPFGSCESIDTTPYAENRRRSKRWTVAGVVAGGVIGFLNKGPKWEEVESSWGVSVEPAEEGIAVGARWSF